MVPTRTVAGVGLAACILVGAVAAADVVLSVIVPLVNRGLAQRALETLDPGPLTAAGLLELAVAGLMIPLFIGTAVVFIVWMWRAHKNLYAFPGVTPRMGAGWSIGGWFIPLANLVIPAIAMNEIARGSLPWKDRDPMRIGTYPLVVFWWVAMVISSCATSVATGLDNMQAEKLPTVLEGPGDFQRYVDYFGSSVGRELIGIVAFAVAAVLVIILVRRISRAQTARIARAYQLGRVTYAPGMPVPGPVTPPAAPDAPAPSPETPAGGPGTPS